MADVVRWVGRLAFGPGPILMVFATLACAYVLESTQASVTGELARRRQAVELEAFLTLDISEARGRELAAALEGSEGIRAVEYIGREGAQREFVALFGEGLLDPGAPNPLPPSVIVRPELDWATSDRVALLAMRLVDVKGVEEVDYPVAWLAALDETAKWSRWTLSSAWLGVGLVLVAAASAVAWRRIALGASSLRALLILGVPGWWCGLGVLAGALASAVVAGALFFGLRLALVEPLLAHAWPIVIVPNQMAPTSLIAFGAGGVLTLTWVARVRALRSAS